MNRLKQNWIKIGAGIFILVVVLFLANRRNTQSIDYPRLTAAQLPKETQTLEENMSNLTENEIYSNSFIKHIRVALNGYLDGSNKGIEDDFVINGSNNDSNCGLAKFDKSYYRSKFIVFNASDNDYGGVQANIIFISKPDTTFWAWIYKLATEDGENGYTLRGFCANNPAEDKREYYTEYIKAVIKESKFSL